MNQNDRLNLNFVKDKHTYGKKRSERVLKQSFISIFHFRSEYSMYIPGSGSKSGTAKGWWLTAESQSLCAESMSKLLFLEDLVLRFKDKDEKKSITLKKEHLNIYMIYWSLFDWSTVWQFLSRGYKIGKIFA